MKVREMEQGGAGCDCGTRVVHIGLGSNVGDRERNLREALDRIATLDLLVVNASSVYETEPVGCGRQPWFLNQAVAVSWPAGPASGRADPTQLLGSFHRIEADMGRERTVPTGPRVIDIDLLLCDDIVIGWDPSGVGDRVIIPHPRLHERRFVLVPLCEMAPDTIHPVLGLRIRELLDRVKDRTEVRLYREAARSFMTLMS